MALYVYDITSGQLYSWSPSDTDPVASAAELAAAGLAAVTGLPALDATHVWDAPTHSVITVAAPKSVAGLFDFWKRFTQAEREAIENLLATGTQASKNRIAAFLRYVNSAGQVDCNDPYIQSSVQLLETAGVIGPGRTAQIVA